MRLDQNAEALQIELLDANRRCLPSLLWELNNIWRILVRVLFGLFDEFVEVVRLVSCLKLRNVKELSANSYIILPSFQIFYQNAFFELFNQLVKLILGNADLDTVNSDLLGHLGRTEKAKMSEWKQNWNEFKGLNKDENMQISMKHTLLVWCLVDLFHLSALFWC